MTFSHPATGAGGAASGYVRALLDLLGARDPFEVLGEHSDLVAGFRTRMVLSEDRPALQGYDEGRWARAFHYRIIRLMPGHDLVHRRQIDRILTSAS